MDGKNKNNNNNSEKTATNNQWTNTGQNRPNNKTERKDGPGGEDAK